MWTVIQGKKYWTSIYNRCSDYDAWISKGLLRSHIIYWQDLPWVDYLDLTRSHMTFDIWYMTFDICHLTSDIWHLTSDIWHLTSDILHLTSDIWRLTWHDTLKWYWCNPNSFIDGFCGYLSNLSLVTHNMYLRDASASKKRCGYSLNILKDHCRWIYFKTIAKMFSHQGFTILFDIEARFWFLQQSHL